jgi:protein-S-isoprenylcysteine O-methyltransferase Ste14
MLGHMSPHGTTVTRGVVRWLIRETMGLLMLPVLLFLCAGRVDWMMGWALVIITALWVASTAWVTLPRNPELLAERVGPRPGTKTWDTLIISLFGAIKIVQYVIAGLDVRYGWSAGFPFALQVVALVLTILGYALIVWSTKENAFFALTVRIQTERGHTVVSSGPYQFVRHPGYAGGILSELAIPAMLGSWYALILGAIIAVLFVVRTALEDRTLIQELPGYAAYTSQVRYRLIPGAW